MSDTFSLKENFLIGTASAAAQIEGGDALSNWTDWSDKGFIKDGSSIRRANDHYNRWKEDADLMRQMGLQLCRLGLEWARIEPQPGKFDDEAISHYKQEIEYLISLGIKPLVTLHHFSNPQWFEEWGAFEKQDNIPLFLRYVDRMVRELGPLVNEYITINEPNVYAMMGYYTGEFPPGKKSMPKMFHVMSVMAAAHIIAYRRIHRQREKMGFTDTKVSFANHVRVFEPKDPKNPLHKSFARQSEYLFQGAMSKAFMKGEFKLPLRNLCHLKKGEYIDFIAVNYYTRSTVSSLADGTREDAPKNDLGWEIYPQGIEEVSKKLYEILPMEIYITENGTCDNNDSFRSRYICDHLRVISESALPFTRYYHWCFCDNFEWLEGESARFGIVHIDYETQKRTIKKSGEFLTDVIKNNGVTEEKQY
ncbi:MAG: family 1 glycosylhydrolase [Lachnospiraceae bacterium]|jgi:beta-glucosidase|nr:family 1 glycosylhydrolase [Lachnospiraceae bacterium]